MDLEENVQEQDRPAQPASRHGKVVIGTASRSYLEQSLIGQLALQGHCGLEADFLHDSHGHVLMGTYVIYGPPKMKQLWDAPDEEAFVQRLFGIYDAQAPKRVQ